MRHRIPLVAGCIRCEQSEARASCRVIVAGAGAAETDDGEGAPPDRRQVDHASVVRVDCAPGLSAVVGHVERGPVRPAVLEVKEPDLAYSGPSVRGPGRRSAYLGPRLAIVMGSSHGRAGTCGACTGDLVNGAHG